LNYYIQHKICWCFETLHVSNYPDENKTHLGATSSHFQHAISDIRPTIRQDPSSTSGSTKPRWVDLRFN